MMMTFDELRSEFETNVIGPGIYAEIRSAVRAVSGSYDPRVYAGGAARWSDALEDLVHQVVVDQLLGRGQLVYAFDVAETLEHLRRLLRRQVRNTLVARRERDVVDNLIGRAKELLEAPPYSARDQGSARRYGLVGKGVEHRVPTADELRSASLIVIGIPQRKGDGMERAPVIYDAEALRAVVSSVAHSLPCSFSLRDLEDVLRASLTPWLLGELMSAEAGHEPEDPGLSPDEIAEVTATTDSIMTELNGDDRRLLALKLANASDGDAAAVLGVSRPTLAKRKKRIFLAVGAQLGDTRDAVREQVVRELAIRVNGPESLA